MSDSDDAIACRVIPVRNDKGGISHRRMDPSRPAMSALIDRRRLLAGGAGLSVAALFADRARADGLVGAARFDPSVGPVDVWTEEWSRQVVIRWGDPLQPGLPSPSSLLAMTAEEAGVRFGYNNDYLAYFPLPTPRDADEGGLLVVNHEYPTLHMMFPGVSADDGPAVLTDDQIRATLSSVGVSVVALERHGETWSVASDARNRRVTARTPIRISGPAAGHPRMRTAADPEGRTVLGTHDNCNGGMTPWGTFLSGEEGSSGFFGGDISGLPDEALLSRYYYGETSGIGEYGWPRVEPRFDVGNAPNEPNRFEWVVEIDPFDKDAVPVKRTALGRFAHEGAHCATAPDGRVVVYLGDDWEFEYLYRFVSRDPWTPDDRAANRDLLDHGVLSVARFDAEGGVEWAPLVFGEGTLTPANGFSDQGDVMIQTRRAADLVGATPMDSPEGYKPHPLTGKIYVALTGNEDRTADRIDAANPRADNRYGHMLELTPPDAGAGPDHAADRFAWRVILLCGSYDGGVPSQGFAADVAAQDRFFAPDNINFDAEGRLWVCSDGPGDRGEDGLWVMPLDGEQAGQSRLIYRPPGGAECCGPAFTPDGRSVFVSIQHPGETSASVASASTFWPDADAPETPRPSVIVLRR